MANTIRWGILGASDFARRHMGPAINAASGAQLFALATSDPAKAAPFEGIAPGLKIHDSYDALIADPDVDAVYVPLPNHLHVEWTAKCIAAGKPVLCEKPIAMKADEIDTLIAARDAAGVLATEAYMIVHHPQWQRARDLYRDGVLGEMMLVDTVFSYDNASEPGNIRNRPETGGGSLPDIGVYTFGAARFVTGEEPNAIDAHINRENDVDVFSHITADFPSFRYSSVTSMRLQNRQYMAFHGTKGVMQLTAPFNANIFGEAQLVLDLQGEPTRSERWPGVNQYVLQVEAFGRSLRDGTPYPWSLEDARGTQAMIDTALAAG
jgi:predicted dehydrogenase